MFINFFYPSTKLCSNGVPSAKCPTRKGTFYPKATKATSRRGIKTLQSRVFYAIVCTLGKKKNKTKILKMIKKPIKIIFNL